MKIPNVPSSFFLIPLALGIEGGLLSLSNWQWSRYQQRLHEQTDVQARPDVRVQGTWMTELTFVLTNQPHPQRPEAELGWRVLTPLLTASGTLVVDRGYARPVMLADGSPDLHSVQPLTEQASVGGFYQPYPQRKGVLAGPDVTTHPRLLAFLNPALIVSDTQPVYLIARTPSAETVLAVPPPLPAPTKHLSYALQWLGMAIAFPVLCAVSWVRSRRAGPRSRRPS